MLATPVMLKAFKGAAAELGPRPHAGPGRAVSSRGAGPTPPRSDRSFPGRPHVRRRRARGQREVCGSTRLLLPVPGLPCGVGPRGDRNPHTDQAAARLGGGSGQCAERWTTAPAVPPGTRTATRRCICSVCPRRTGTARRPPRRPPPSGGIATAGCSPTSNPPGPQGQRLGSPDPGIPRLWPWGGFNTWLWPLLHLWIWH